MTDKDLPSICNYLNTSNTYSGIDFTTGTSGIGLAVGEYEKEHYLYNVNKAIAARQQLKIDPFAGEKNRFDLSTPIKEKGKENVIMSEKINRRIVQVFIADPHLDVPLDKALLYKGEQKLTDATDQELFFDIGINSILKLHNEERVKWFDRRATRTAGKDIMLEEVRIRDLVMIVTEVAKF